ncbi:MAG: anti-sigma factor [Caldimonas sp.]
MDYARPDLADRLACAFVVGTLRGPARRRFETLLPAHPALRAATHAWQERLMPLTVVIAPEAPTARVWQRIEARIDGAVAGATGSNASSSSALHRGAGSRLAFWRGLSAFAGIAAVVLAVLLISPQPVQPPIVVVLSATGAPAGSVAPASFVASISADGRALVTRPLVRVGLQADRALELWAIPAGGAPRSLGLISASGATVLQKRQELEGADALAVSLEPAGGSPTGAPTGPVLYAGKLVL